jgi:hypothetical protein
MGRSWTAEKVGKGYGKMFFEAQKLGRKIDVELMYDHHLDDEDAGDDIFCELYYHVRITDGNGYNLKVYGQATARTLKDALNGAIKTAKEYHEKYPWELDEIKRFWDIQ